MKMKAIIPESSTEESGDESDAEVGGGDDSESAVSEENNAAGSCREFRHQWKYPKYVMAEAATSFV